VFVRRHARTGLATRSFARIWLGVLGWASTQPRARAMNDVGAASSRGHPIIARLAALPRANAWLPWRVAAFVSMSLVIPAATGMALATPGHLSLAVRSRWDAPRATARDVRKLLDLGHYAAAESAAVALVARLEISSHPSPSPLADALDLGVTSLVGGGKFWEPRALAWAESALAIRERNPGKDSLAYARSLYALGTVLAARRDAPAPLWATLPPHERGTAAAVFASVVRIRERALGPRHRDTATAIHALGWETLLERRIAAADSLIRRASAIRQRILPADHPDRAESGAALAVMAEYLGRGDTTLYAHAIAATERAVGPDHPMLAAQLLWYSEFLRGIAAQYDRAHAVLERAVGIYERRLGPLNLLTARAVRLTGVNLHWSGRLEQSLPWLQRALEVTTALVGPGHVETALPLFELAGALSLLGDEVAARPLFERALEIWAPILAPDDRLLASALQSLGHHYLATGETARAEPLIERALAMKRRHPERGLALTVELMGQVYAGDTARAHPLFREAARLYCQIAPGTPYEYKGLMMFAGLASAAGDLDEAILYYQRAIAISERTRPFDLAWAGRDFANVLRRAGRNAEATRSFDRSLRTAEEVLGPTHTMTAVILKDIGNHLVSLGKADSGLRALLRAEEIVRAHLERSIRVLPESQALLRASSGLGTARDELVSLVVGDPDPSRIELVWDAVVRSRALVLDEMGARHRMLYSHPDPEVRALAARYDSLGQWQSRIELSGPGTSDLVPVLQRVAHERELVARDLAERSASFREQRQRARIGLAEVAGGLPPGSALLAFVRHQRLSSGPDGSPAGPSPFVYTAFVLRAGGEAPVVVALPEADAVDREVALWKREVARALPTGAVLASTLEDEYRRTGARLRRLIWEPVATHMLGVERVFVVPDGPLHFLNFATLPVGTSGYLLERGPLLHYLSAERDLALEAPGSRRGSGLLAVGAPEFDADPASLIDETVVTGEALGAGYRGPRVACADFSDVRFGPLPHAESELTDLEDLWREVGPAERPAIGPPIREPSIILRGARASEAAFKAKAQRRRIVHVATHGFFLGEDCTAEPGHRGIGGMTIAGEPPPAHTRPIESPLRLSGVALAGANLRDRAPPNHDDGILTAEEIASLDLSGVEWAVLSACDTGLGEILAGEGVLGLRRALQVAGVRTSIMSLWRVDDRAARRWMRALYQARWKLGCDTPESMRRASIAVLKERRAAGMSTHPATWGSFIAVGDWR